MNAAPLCLVTIEELRALVPDQVYALTIRDLPNVRAESRGSTYFMRFTKMEVAQQHWIPREVGDEDNPAIYLVYGVADDNPNVIMGFHAWLIEKIEEKS